MGLVWDTFYVTLRKVVRRIWSLPYTTHCDILSIINNIDYVEREKDVLSLFGPAWTVLMLFSMFL